MSACTFGTLFLIPNTLGGNILSEVLPTQVQTQALHLTYFIVENAKNARAFLKQLGLQTPLKELQIHELNINTPIHALPALMQPLLDGYDIGLISEAGCPAVADPGSNLVHLAHQHNIPVKPLVGPSSLLLALMGSGLNGQSFAFQGYLPIQAAERVRSLRSLEKLARQYQQTQIFIETPYRNQALFEALIQTLAPTTWLCIASDLTTENEKIITRRIQEWKKHKTALPRSPTVFLFLPH